MERVLVLTDEAKTLRRLIYGLSHLNHVVVHAQGLASLHAQLARATISMAVVDVGMGHGEALELLRTLRADPRSQQIPVLALTPTPQVSARRELREAGASAVGSSEMSLVSLSTCLQAVMHIGERVPSSRFR